jgi:hypothetical protein
MQSECVIQPHEPLSPLTVSQPPTSVQPLPCILFIGMCLVFYQPLPAVKHFTCDIIFKIKVTLFAEETGNRAAGRKCAVSEICVRYQRSMKSKIFIYEN